ncbi:MAG: hypothetical protein QOA70_06805 [Nitrososphaeraceae archaeon]|nr:hypothetical protein [Nitrososphaeraceae archaeon]
MKYLYIFLAGAIIAVLIYLFAGRCEPNVETAFDIEPIQKHFQAKIDSVKALETKIKESLALDVEKEKARAEAFKIENSKLKKRLAEKKQAAQPVIDSNQNVKELVDFYDSTVSILENRIDTLYRDNQVKTAKVDDLIKLHDEEAEQFKEHVKQLSDLALSEQKKNRKLKNKKFSIGPHVGYDVTNKPTFGVSVQFKVFSF